MHAYDSLRTDLFAFECVRGYASVCVFRLLGYECQCSSFGTSFHPRECLRGINECEEAETAATATAAVAAVIVPAVVVRTNSRSRNTNINSKNSSSNTRSNSRISFPLIFVFGQQVHVFLFSFCS